MIPIAIAIAVISVLALGMIAVEMSQNTAMEQKQSQQSSLENIKDKENLKVSRSGSVFSFINPQNSQVHVKYIRILDSSGNMVARIPYDKKFSTFSNSSNDLSSVIPSQYLK